MRGNFSVKIIFLSFICSISLAASVKKSEKAAVKSENLQPLPELEYDATVRIKGPANIKHNKLTWVYNTKKIPQLVVPFKVLTKYTSIKVVNLGSDEPKIFDKGQSKVYDFYIESSAAEVYIDGNNSPIRIDITDVQSSILISPQCDENKIKFKIDSKSDKDEKTKNKYVGILCLRNSETGNAEIYVTHGFEFSYFNSSLFEVSGKGDAYKKYELTTQLVAQVNSRIGVFSWKDRNKVTTIEIFVVENVFKSNKEFVKADVGLGFNMFNLVQNGTNASKTNSIISYGDIYISPLNINSRARINWHAQITDISGSSKIPTQSSKTSIGWDYYFPQEKYEVALTGYMSFVNAYSFEISAFNTMQMMEFDVNYATFALGRKYKLSFNLGYGFATGEGSSGNYLELSPKLHFVYGKHTLFTQLLWTNAQFKNASTSSESKTDNLAIILGTSY